MLTSTSLVQKVFISYCRDDPRLADIQLLVDKLRAKDDLDVEMQTAAHDDNKSNDDKIRQLIDSTEVFVLFISEAFKNCRHCTKEATYILNTKSSFVPVKMLDKLDGWIGLSVAGKLYIDFSSDTTDVELAAANVLVRVYGYLEKQENGQLGEHFQTQRRSLSALITDVQRKAEQERKSLIRPVDETAESSNKQQAEITAPIKKMKESNVLLSYHWGYDPNQVLELFNELSTYRLQIRRGDGNAIGSTYSNVAKEVDAADVVVVVFSEDFKKSKLCRDGLLYAKQRGKVIIPVRQQPGCAVDGWIEVAFGADGDKSSSPIELTTVGDDALKTCAETIVRRIEKDLNLTPSSIDLRSWPSSINPELKADIIDTARRISETRPDSLSYRPCQFGASKIPQVYVTHCATERSNQVDQVVQHLNESGDLSFNFGKASDLPNEADRNLIAKMIEDCDMALLFLSQKSPNCVICRREIEYVLSMKKRYFVVELDERCSDEGFQGILGVGKAPIQFLDGQLPEAVSLEVLRQIYGHLEDQGCFHTSISTCEMKEYYGDQRMAVQKEIWALSARKLMSADEEEVSETLQVLTAHSAINKTRKPVTKDKVFVFISYSWAEAANPDAVRAVCERLQKRTDIKLEVWLDQKDMLNSIRTDMAEGIERSDVVIIFYSREYAESNDCKKEAHYALDRGVSIIPVVMQKTYPVSGWLAVRLNQKQVPITYEGVDKTTQEIVDRIKIMTNMRLVKCNIPPVSSDYEIAKGYESFKVFLESHCKFRGKAATTFLVTGKKDSGKTSLVSHFLGEMENESFLLKECRIRYIAWINAKELYEILDITLRRSAFLRALGTVCRQALNIPILGESFPAINNAIENATKDGCLFLLAVDDIQNANILECLQELSPSVRCVAICDNFGSECVQHGVVSCCLKVTRTKEETKLQLQTLLPQNGREARESTKIKALANNCRESPTLMNLVQSKLEADQSYGSAILNSLAAKNIELTPRNSLLMIMDCYFAEAVDNSPTLNNNITRGHYFSLLIFEPGQVFDVKDAACLFEMWDDMPSAYAACNALKKAKLLREVKNNNEGDWKFCIDAAVHEAAVDYAKSFGYPNLLPQLRQMILNHNALRNAIRGTRPSVFNMVLKHLTIETLAKISSEQPTDDKKTLLHVLYENRDHWRRFVGTSSEKSVALEVFIKILDKLHSGGVDVVSILTLTDRTGQCLLLDIRESRSEQAELVRLAQIIESLGGYRLRPGCYEARIWLSLEGMLRDTSAYLLTQAVLRGDKNAVVDLLANYPEKINEKCEPSGESPLSAACSKGFVEIVKILVDKGADANSANNNGVTPLMKASLSGSLEIIKILHENGAVIDTIDKNGNTAVILAAVGGHVDAIKYFAQNGADLVECNRKGMNVLYFLAQNGHDTTVLKFVLNRGGYSSKQLAIAFWHAAKNGHLAVANILIKMCPKIDLVKMTNKSPPVISLAALNGHRDVVRLLLEKGVQADGRDSEDFTSLMHAVRHGHLPVVEVLVEAGAQVNAKKANGTTALFYAAQYGYLAIAKFLVSKGAEVDARNNLGHTALLRAVEADQQEIVPFLIEEGADVRSVDNASFSPLLTAARNGNGEMILLLARHGADIDATIGNNQTALMIAALNGCYDAVQALLQCGAGADIVDDDMHTALQYAQMGTTMDHYKIFQLLKTVTGDLRRIRRRSNFRTSPTQYLEMHLDRSLPIKPRFSTDALTDTIRPVSNVFDRRLSSIILAEEDF